MFLKSVHGETVTHAGKFPLKFVQHRGGKVGVSYKIGRKQRNLPFVCTGSKVGFGLAGTIDIYIGELFISHFDRLFQNAFPGGVGEHPCIVDCLGYSVARDAQFIRDVLNGDTVSHGSHILSQYGIFRYFPRYFSLSYLYGAWEFFEFYIIIM